MMCSNSPAPSGYVYSYYDRSTSCPAYSPTSFNTISIKVPGYQETVCGTSPIPSNYVVIAYDRSPYCPFYSPTSTNTKIIQRV
jgi:hypothetical protein